MEPRFTLPDENPSIHLLVLLASGGSLVVRKKRKQAQEIIKLWYEAKLKGTAAVLAMADKKHTFAVDLSWVIAMQVVENDSPAARQLRADEKQAAALEKLSRQGEQGNEWMN